MSKTKKGAMPTMIMDREKMGTAGKCPACGRPFEMGDSVVLACGGWGDELRYVHEREATFDQARSAYVESSCAEGRL